ncbi:MAG: hypothetical protein WC655_20585 [Candidatus Hydrogenedentales bacterium]
MISVAMSATAALLQAASEQMRSSERWPDPATAFACRILDGAGLPRPKFASYPVAVPSAASLRLTPQLAAHGYLLENAEDNDNAVWVEAIDHLRGREIFPSDRQSFVYNPIEVLGIAEGLSTLNVADGRRTWFVDTLRRGFSNQYFRSPASSLGAYVALALLDREVAENQHLDLIDLPDLATTELILVAGIGIAFPNLSPVPPDDLERELLGRVLTHEIAVNDAAEAATLFAFAQRVRDRLLAPKSLIDDLDKITILCRRFPLFADTMRTRQQKRIPFSITDEYDVQDLLHAILRLHFDDVRPEEHTPSYAGSHSRVDFLLPRERMLIEAKMTRKGLIQKEVVNQLLIDVGRYSKVEGIDTLVCVIYDPERYCTNPKAIETDVENSGTRLKIRVVVCPQVI